jgi:four helix bundle protein
MQIKSAKDLDVYKQSYQLAMDVFELSKQWPSDERYALTDQIRRASRSVCANLREAWAKRRYQAHFVSKLTDADGECNEVDTWLDFAKDCGYLRECEHGRLVAQSSRVRAMLGAMLNNPAPFLLHGKS